MEEYGLLLRYPELRPPECEYLQEDAGGEFYAVANASDAARYPTYGLWRGAQERAINQGWPMLFCHHHALLLQFTHEPRTNKNLGGGL